MGNLDTHGIHGYSLVIHATNDDDVPTPSDDSSDNEESGGGTSDEPTLDFPPGTPGS